MYSFAFLALHWQEVALQIGMDGAEQILKDFSSFETVAHWQRIADLNFAWEKVLVLMTCVTWSGSLPRKEADF